MDIDILRYFFIGMCLCCIGFQLYIGYKNDLKKEKMANLANENKKYLIFNKSLYQNYNNQKITDEEISKAQNDIYKINYKFDLDNIE